MKVIVLASGSKGNVTYVEYKNTKILIDLGMNLKYIRTELKNNDIDINDIDAVLITHTHNDHVSSLEVFVKNHKAKIYVTAKMNKDLNLIDFETIMETNNIKDFIVDSIQTSHDKPSVGYIIKGDTEMVYITDTGYLKESYHKKLMNKELYMFESNHDVEMLMDGPYPYYLKQRILSDKGHLSNRVAAEHLKKLVGERTKHIILAHLSECNNCELLADSTLRDHLGETDINIVIAKQSKPLKAIKF